MRKTLLSILALACMLWPSADASAQRAREVLDATAARMTQSGDVKAQFKATQFEGTTPSGDASGTILMSGRRFHVTTNQLTSWYDGATEWSMMNGSNEVNVSTPTEEEQASINPVALIGIYKKGYRLSLKESTLRGRPTFVVSMQAKNSKAPFSYIIVDIDKATYNPLCLRAKKDNDWMRLSILSFQNGLSLPASTFSFPSQEYPDVEVIDLR